MTPPSRRWRLAAARGLLATGGSDYHGDRGDYAAAQAFVHVPPEAGAALLAALAERGVVRSVDPSGCAGTTRRATRRRLASA